MQKYKSNITSTTGAAIRNVPVTVLNEAGDLASLFLDRAGDIAAPNPLATDSSGNFYFYAVNGRYSLRTTVEGVTITDDDVVLLQDPVEITVAGPIAEAIAAAQAAARQAQDAVDASGIPDLVAAAQNAVIDSNQALQEARGASQASTEAKVAAESAKSAAELAKGDAQSASATASTAAQQASAAAQSAAQSAASIDPAAIYQAIGGKVDIQPNAGLMTDVERQRLAGIAEGATKNETDSALRDRANHTGMQSIETVAGLRFALDAVVVLPFTVCGGSANAITLTSVAPGGAIVRGATKVFRATAANTGAVTINLDGLGAVAAVTVTGVALPAGYIRTDVDTLATYNGTNWVVDRQVEKGSNTNGTFIRYANGTMEVWSASRSVAVAVGNTQLDSNLPATFTSTSSMSVVYTTVAQGNSGYSVKYGWGSAVNIGSANIDNVSAAQNISILNCYVKGFWY